jgi:hypothetical protein
MQALYQWQKKVQMRVQAKQQKTTRMHAGAVLEGGYASVTDVDGFV